VLLFGMALRGWLWLHDVASTPFDLAAKPKSGVYMTLVYYPTSTRLDGLLAGVAAAAVRTFRPALWSWFAARANLWLAAGFVGAILSAAFFGGQIPSFWACVLGFPLLSASFALMVAAGAVPRSLIGSRAIPGAGALAAGAYSLYLSHKMLFGIVGGLFAHADPQLHAIALPAAFAVAYVVGAALYWAVERPFLKMRDRLGARTPRPATVEPAAA
jgi:peptidoglycan/LPS O-acetylase OafA/YrhL